MRVSEKPLKHYPLWLRPFFWKQKKTYGQVLKPGLVWGLVPKLFAGVALLYGAINRKSSLIDPVTRSLVTVRVSQINWCAFCVDLNAKTLAERAGSMDKVEALENWREAEAFDEREKAVLDYTESVTHSDRQVTDEQVETLRQWYDDDGIVELTGLIAFQNLSSKFNAALDVPAQGFCKL